MKITVDTSTHTLVRFWLVPLGIVIAGYAAYSARTALIILGSALFLALALNQPVSKLAKHLPGNSRIISTTIAFCAVVGFIGSFIFIAMPPVFEQTVKFAKTIPELVEQAKVQSEQVGKLVDRYGLQSQLNQTVASLENNSTKWASRLGSNVVTGISSVFSFMAALFLVLVLSFLMLIEGPSWMKRLWGLYKDPVKLEHHRTIVQRMNAVVSGYVNGQLAVSGLGAVVAGFTVFAISLFTNVPMNLAVPAAAITFVLSLIPMFGATLSGVLITMLLAFNDVGAAIVYVIFFIVYQQIENNYVSPAIQSKTLDLSALTILASVTIGIYLFGLAGGIISIPIAGAIKVLIDAHLDKAKEVRAKEGSPLHKLVGKSTKKV